MFGFHRKPAPTDPLTDLSEAIPIDVLSRDAWDALRTLRAAGHGVSAYRTGDSSGPWLIWVRPAYKWQRGCFTPAEWEAFYRQWLALAHQSGTLTRKHWLSVCEALGETQRSGHLVAQEPPREIEIHTGAADCPCAPCQERAKLLTAIAQGEALLADEDALPGVRENLPPILAALRRRAGVAEVR